MLTKMTLHHCLYLSSLFVLDHALHTFVGNARLNSRSSLQGINLLDTTKTDTEDI